MALPPPESSRGPKAIGTARANVAEWRPPRRTAILMMTAELQWFNGSVKSHI
jgi:hypothetical protein